MNDFLDSTEDSVDSAPEELIKQVFQGTELDQEQMRLISQKLVISDSSSGDDDSRQSLQYHQERISIWIYFIFDFLSNLIYQSVLFWLLYFFFDQFISGLNSVDCLATKSESVFFYFRVSLLKFRPLHIIIKLLAYF